MSAPSFSGSGTGLTALNASGISAGTLNDSRLSANIPRKNAANAFTASVTAPSFSGNGAALTGLNAASLAAGTVADVRLPSNLACTNASTAAFVENVTAAKFAGPGNKAPVFPGSGIGTVAKDRDTVRLVNPLCKSTSKVIVTPQSSTGGIPVNYVKPGKGFIDVFLTGKAKTAVKLAYLIMG